MLVKYKVGLGIEKFDTEEGKTIDVPVVYFPMFRMASEKEEK